MLTTSVLVSCFSTVGPVSSTLPPDQGEAARGASSPRCRVRRRRVGLGRNGALGPQWLYGRLLLYRTHRRSHRSRHGVALWTVQLAAGPVGCEKRIPHHPPTIPQLFQRSIFLDPDQRTNRLLCGRRFRWEHAKWLGTLR